MMSEFQLREGMFCRDDKGQKVGPMHGKDGYWCYPESKGIFRDDGTSVGIRDPDLLSEWQDDTPAADLTPNKYARTIRSETVDVYDVLHAFNVTDAATAHAVKKLLMAGQRGHKDKITDLREAIASVERQIQMEEEK